jgi:protein-S-isoprenylcysteine O-methyltransferase Ste14
MKNKDNRNTITLVVVVVAVLIILGLFGFGFRNYGMMGGYNNGFISFAGIFGILMVVLVIAGIYWLIKNANRN